MDSLNRQVWAAGMSFTALGFEAGIRVSEPEALEELIPRLPLGWNPVERATVPRLYSLRLPRPDETRGRRHYSLLYADHVLLSRSLSRAETLDKFADLTRMDMAERSTRRVIVQAGVVGFGNQALLLTGKRQSGKSTLVAELLRAGASYYSDCLAILDDRGRIHPYPCSLKLADSEVTAESLGSRVARRPLLASLVLCLRYRPEARWRGKLLEGGRGVLEMMKYTPSARHRPQAALKTLSRALSSARVWRGTRGEAEESLPAILKMLQAKG